MSMNEGIYIVYVTRIHFMHVHVCAHKQAYMFKMAKVTSEASDIHYILVVHTT